MKHARGHQRRAGAGVNAVATTTLSGPRIANPYRAYPPSCLADPLPDTPSGPFTSFQMPLYTRDCGGNRGDAGDGDDHALAHGLQQQRQPDAVQHRSAARTRRC